MEFSPLRMRSIIKQCNTWNDTNVLYAPCVAQLGNSSPCYHVSQNVVYLFLRESTFSENKRTFHLTLPLAVAKPGDNGVDKIEHGIEIYLLIYI